MRMKGIAITMGLGAVAGAVAISMMPKNSATKKMAQKAAYKVEDAACKVSDKLTQQMSS